MFGHLCLFVLKSLASGETFQTILDHMQCYGGGYTLNVIGKIPFKPKSGFVLPKHRCTGPYNPIRLQRDSKDRPLPGEEPYNALDDAIAMRHDICYRDNETGKPESRGRRKNVNRQMVRGIVGLKHRLGMEIWSTRLVDELHKPVRKRFQKRGVFAKQLDGIRTADLVDISPYSISNSGYKYLHTVIDVFSKYGWIAPLKTKTSKEFAMAFHTLFTTTNAPSSRLWTDKGTVFYNKQWKRLLATNIVI